MFIMLKFKQKIKMWRCLVGSGPRGKHCFLLLLRIFQLIIWSFQDRKIISSLINVWQSIPAQIFKPVHLLFKIILIMKNFKYIRNTESGTTDNCYHHQLNSCSCLCWRSCPHPLVFLLSRGWQWPEVGRCHPHRLIT